MAARSIFAMRKAEGKVLPQCLQEIPVDPGKMCETLPGWLVRIATSGRIIIVLDVHSSGR
jgi:hypothetical protein